MPHQETEMSPAANAVADAEEQRLFRQAVNSSADLQRKLGAQAAAAPRLCVGEDGQLRLACHPGLLHRGTQIG